MDEIWKYLVPSIISLCGLVVSLFITNKLSPLDKKLGILCEIVTQLKRDNEKQWQEITTLRSGLDHLCGEHKSIVERGVHETHSGK